MKKRYLIGIGNRTMADDGVGPRVAEALAAHSAPTFETVVLGQDALGLLSYFDEATEHIVLVDCVRMGRTPGDCAVFSPDNVTSDRQADRITTHEADVLRVIDLGRQMGLAVPRITIVGIEPERVEPGLELGPTLSRRFGEYVGAALTALDAPPIT